MSKKMTELEQTIHAMERSQICAHPRHCHSFQTVNFMISASQKCEGCETRIQSVVFASSDSSKQIVKCAACGVYAHRTCASSRHPVWKERCPINCPMLNSPSAKASPSPRKKNCSVEEVVGNLSLDSWSEDCTVEEKDCEMNEGDNAEEPPLTMEWTSDGPPRHWASGDPAVVSTITIPSSVEAPNNDSSGDEVHVSPLHHADHPFASVSRALQENVLAHFDSERNQPSEEAKDPGEASAGVGAALSVKAERPSVESETKQPTTLAKLASGTIGAVRATVNFPARLGMATVAGGIAGGVAGLAMAGPAGAYAGYKLGQTAGVLGVILEGSVSIGVVVASVATASYTANQIKDHIEERRVLTMGEEGTSRKVLLVRPNIKVDPTWEDLCTEAKRSAPKPSARGKFFFLPDESSAARERYQRDVDIIQPSEEEIPTTDKVLLLASRILNDKTSVPGHVYRSLVKTFEQRCSEPMVDEGGVPSRRRRDDAHAVVKHVTATLLEERPGFGQTAALTELTATAVESLVFGRRVYGLVFEEIQHELTQKDADLTEKIAFFERNRPNFASVANRTSDEAIQALMLLPTSHTAVEKLNFCTTFLERISEHFSATCGSSSALCADSLLKMVCQHVLVARLASINAEIAFLEEFARDEQLLRGKEGYALVTLQAALHFLNMSSDLEDDIFEQDNYEKNVPVHSAGKRRPGNLTSSPVGLGESGELL